MQIEPFNPRSRALTVVLLLLAMLSFQMGAALAKQLFPRVGVTGTTALRLGFAALMLTAVWRPWRVRPSPRELRTILIYGAAMGWMNLFFYLALSRIPLGVAVAVEFTGPLAVAIAASRRPVDFLWVGSAILGLILLLPQGVQITTDAFGGIAFALAAGVCWALYIVFGKRVGTLHRGRAVALGTCTAAVCIVPIGVSHAGLALFSAAILPLALSLAVLSSALPYSLEMFVLSRMPARGSIFLDEVLSTVQWIAIACIVLASAGSAATTREPGTASAD
jgi:inner membrane transporter RhtA